VFGDAAQTQALNWSTLSSWPRNSTRTRCAWRLHACCWATAPSRLGADAHVEADAYSEAPIPSTTLLAAGVINCAIYA